MIMINSMTNLHIRSWFLLLLFLLTAASSFICDLASILVLPLPIPEKKSLSISLYYPFPSQIITISPTKRSKSSRRDLASGGLKPSEGNSRGTSHFGLSNPSDPNWQYVTGGETQIHSISSWSLWWAKATHLWLPGLMTLPRLDACDARRLADAADSFLIRCWCWADLTDVKMVFVWVRFPRTGILAKMWSFFC